MAYCRVLGLLSGTSMDGIDVAAADLRLDSSGAIELRPVGHAEFPFPGSLRTRLIESLPPQPCTAQRLCQLDTEVGQAFAAAAVSGLRELAGNQADLVSSLGQTLYHWVADGRTQGTLQIGQPAWIAEATGLPVIADLRARDVAGGGSGAPLAVALDTLWLAGGGKPRIALNIGGIANITVVGTGPPLAYDTGPGNALIDAAVRLVTQGKSSQDTDGEIAASGQVHADMLTALLADPYFQQSPPKSTGKEHFSTAYLRHHLADFPVISDADLLATLTELTAATIAACCQRHDAELVIASGGGIRNSTLMNALCRRLITHSIELTTSDAWGLPASGKEAYLSALLGFLTWNGLPSTTGQNEPRLLGSITPGARPLQLPKPTATRFNRLRVVPAIPTNPTPAPTSQEA